MIGFLKKRFFLIFLIPGIFLYTVLVIYPIFSAMRLSLFQWNGIGAQVFVGFGNYKELFTDSYLMGQFTNALGNSLKLFLLTVFVQTPIQIILAYMVYSKMKAHRFAQVIIFAPQFITTPVIVFIFRLLLDDNIGMVNNLLHWVGLGSLAKPWLGIPGLGVFFMYIMITWGGVGVGMTFFIGAMNMVSRDGIEAAYIEGAGYWTRLIRVILPQIRITVINLILIAYIYAMTMFDFSYILGGTTGGINGSIDVMALFFYRVAFGDSNPVGGRLAANSIGMGTTVACVLFLLIFIIALLQVIFLNREKNGE
ncbi:MAG: sugar ABC transporter permease [Spirochaetaceae bacterium]|jgi:ABC-type sugar transport system permease subunit|nr:sugar ABC transporter permease [Spirochaetaceae bacterium]